MKRIFSIDGKRHILNTKTDACLNAENGENFTGTDLYFHEKTHTFYEKNWSRWENSEPSINILTPDQVIRYTQERYIDDDDLDAIVRAIEETEKN